MSSHFEPPTIARTGCWTLPDPTGYLAAHDANCHTATREAADNHRSDLLASVFEDDDPTDYEPYPDPATCHRIHCQACGTGLGHPAGVHYDSARAALEEAQDQGWCLSGARWACPRCQEHAKLREY